VDTNIYVERLAFTPAVSSRIIVHYTSNRLAECVYTCIGLAAVLPPYPKLQSRFPSTTNDEVDTMRLLVEVFVPTVNRTAKYSNPLQREMSDSSFSRGGRPEGPK
jgi:hypothetical protein